jgi:hypothetical protein
MHIHTHTRTHAHHYFSQLLYWKDVKARKSGENPKGTVDVGAFTELSMPTKGKGGEQGLVLSFSFTAEGKAKYVCVCVCMCMCM